MRQYFRIDSHFNESVYHICIFLARTTKANLKKGGYNCTCIDGYSGKGKDAEVIDGILVRKPGCIKDGAGVTMFTPLVALVEMLYNSTNTNTTQGNSTYANSTIGNSIYGNYTHANSTQENSTHENNIEATTAKAISKPPVQDIVIQFVHQEDSIEKTDEIKPEDLRPENSYSVIVPFYVVMFSFVALLM